MNTNELTQQQTERQDFVDNNILEFLNQMQPEMRGTIEHDIELIGKVRDAIQTVLVDDLRLCTEMEFYPYVRERPYYKPTNDDIEEGFFNREAGYES